MEELGISFVFPGHGSVFNGLKLRTAEIMQHYEQRQNEIIRVLNGNLKSIYQIATELSWRAEVGGVALQELPIWDKRMAIRKTAAHIRFLTLQDRIGKVDRDGVSLFLVKD